MVCGPDNSYLWILARDPEMKNELKDSLMAKASALGFDVSKLIFVDHRWLSLLPYLSTWCHWLYHWDGVTIGPVPLIFWESPWANAYWTLNSSDTEYRNTLRAQASTWWFHAINWAYLSPVIFQRQISLHSVFSVKHLCDLTLQTQSLVEFEICAYRQDITVLI